MCVSEDYKTTLVSFHNSQEGNIFPIFSCPIQVNLSPHQTAISFVICVIVHLINLVDHKSSFSLSLFFVLHCIAYDLGSILGFGAGAAGWYCEDDPGFRLPCTTVLRDRHQA